MSTQECNTHHHFNHHAPMGATLHQPDDQHALIMNAATMQHCVAAPHAGMKSGGIVADSKDAGDISTLKIRKSDDVSPVKNSKSSGDDANDSGSCADPYEELPDICDVFDAEYRHVFIVPKEHVCHVPPKFFKVSNSRLVLCLNGDSDKCPKGSDCKFIHVNRPLSTFQKQEIHINYAWRDLDAVLYPRTKNACEEQTVSVLYPTTAGQIDATNDYTTTVGLREEHIPASHIIATEGSRRLSELSAPTAEPLLACLDFYLDRVCKCGPTCKRMHVAHLDAEAKAFQRAPAPRQQLIIAQRLSEGRTKKKKYRGRRKKKNKAGDAKEEDDDDIEDVAEDDDAPLERQQLPLADNKTATTDGNATSFENSMEHANTATTTKMNSRAPTKLEDAPSTVVAGTDDKDDGELLPQLPTASHIAPDVALIAKSNKNNSRCQEKDFSPEFSMKDDDGSESVVHGSMSSGSEAPLSPLVMPETTPIVSTSIKMANGGANSAMLPMWSTEPLTQASTGSRHSPSLIIASRTAAISPQPRSCNSSGILSTPNSRRRVLRHSEHLNPQDQGSFKQRTSFAHNDSTPSTAAPHPATVHHQPRMRQPPQAPRAPIQRPAQHFVASSPFISPHLGCPGVPPTNNVAYVPATVQPQVVVGGAVLPPVLPPAYANAALPSVMSPPVLPTCVPSQQQQQQQQQQPQAHSQQQQALLETLDDGVFDEEEGEKSVSYVWNPYAHGAEEARCAASHSNLSIK